MNLFRLFLLVFLLNFTNAYAQKNKPLIKISKSPSFSLPIDCIPNENCWVMNYVDMGPDDGKQTDPACMHRTYDGHKGTDFAIYDEITMKQGVNALAAMDGTIKKIRDGEVDQWATQTELEQIKDERKECGNAILIDHNNGLQSIYCHLKQNSIAVKAGQIVKRGDVIGQVGLSGYTKFPHLHFGVLWEGAIIDPFTGQANIKKCEVRKKRLWNKNLVLDYQPLIIQKTGFRNSRPELKQIEHDAKTPPSIPLSSDLFTFWVTLLGVEKEDIITIEIKDPNGKIFAQRVIKQPSTRARQFYYTGRKLSTTKLQEGAYTGSIKVSRTDKQGGTQVWNKSRAILITP